jgi:hypothetical protein
VPKPPPYLSRLAFASLLSYSPRGQTQTSIQSQRVRDAVKRDSVWPGHTRPFLQLAAERLLVDAQGGQFAGFFGKGVALVPVPRSAPLTKGALWPGRRLCEEIQRLGLGGPILAALERTKPVQKAAFASVAGRSRPTVEDHLLSMQWVRDLASPSGFLLVDDIVTSGSQLIAAASLLQEAFPGPKSELSGSSVP